MKAIKYVVVLCWAAMAITLAATCQAPPDTSRPIRFTPEGTTVETVEITAANPLSESVSEVEVETEIETEPVYTYGTAYVNTPDGSGLNIRKWPEICLESKVCAVPHRTQFTTIDFDESNEWTQILFEDEIRYVATQYLSLEEPEPLKTHPYYGIWSGKYWHFSPEEIDNQWAGRKSWKPVLPTGTTRAWQDYLYEKLAAVGREWFYPYAVAQAMQESGFNPLNQIGNDSDPDKGLFSFRIWYWNSAYGDIYDWHAQINAYIDRVLPYLTSNTEEAINRAIVQHYNSSNQELNEKYIKDVRKRLPELWEFQSEGRGESYGF